MARFVLFALFEALNIVFHSENGAICLAPEQILCPVLSFRQILNLLNQPKLPLNQKFVTIVVDCKFRNNSESEIIAGGRERAANL